MINNHPKAALCSLGANFNLKFGERITHVAA